MTKQERKYYENGCIEGFTDAIKLMCETFQNMALQLPEGHPVREFIRGVVAKFDDESHKTIALYAATLKFDGKIEEHRVQ